MPTTADTLAIHGGQPIRQQRMPPRLAFDKDEIASVMAAMEYYREKDQDPPYQGHFEERFCEAFADYMGGGFADARREGRGGVQPPEHFGDRGVEDFGGAMLFNPEVGDEEQEAARWVGFCLLRALCRITIGMATTTSPHCMLVDGSASGVVRVSTRPFRSFELRTIWDI